MQFSHHFGNDILQITGSIGSYNNIFNSSFLYRVLIGFFFIKLKTWRGRDNDRQRGNEKMQERERVKRKHLDRKVLFCSFLEREIWHAKENCTILRYISISRTVGNTSVNTSIFFLSFYTNLKWYYTQANGMVEKDE